MDKTKTTEDYVDEAIAKFKEEFPEAIHLTEEQKEFCYRTAAFIIEDSESPFQVHILTETLLAIVGNFYQQFIDDPNKMDEMLTTILNNKGIQFN